MKQLVFIGAALTLAAALAVLPGQARSQAGSNGASVYQQKCQMCHGAPGGKGVMGPSLTGVVGRKAGTAPGFAYSPAMQSAKLSWDVTTLDRYLAQPTAVVPGSRMPVGLPSAAEREAVIRYLRQLR